MPLPYSTDDLLRVLVRGRLRLKDHCVSKNVRRNATKTDKRYNTECRERQAFEDLVTPNDRCSKQHPLSINTLINNYTVKVRRQPRDMR